MVLLRVNYKDLRRWDMLKNVDEDFLRKVRAFHVFGNDRDDGGQSYLLMTDDLEVYGIGKNNFGQLGIGSREDTTRPILVTGLTGLKVKNISTGSGFVVIATEDADGNLKVFEWGRNDKHQLGIGVLANRRNPSEVTYFKDVKIKHLSSGRSHTLVVTKGNKVVTWGTFDYAADLTSQTSYRKPTGLDKLKSARSAVCGSSYSMVAASNGEVYTRGLLHSPFLSLQLKLNIKVKKIVPGPKYLSVLTADGEVYTCQVNGVSDTVLLKKVEFTPGSEIQPSTTDLITTWINDVIVAVTKNGIYYWDKSSEPNPVRAENDKIMSIFYNKPTPGLVRVSQEDEPEIIEDVLETSSESDAQSVDQEEVLTDDLSAKETEEKDVNEGKGIVIKPKVDVDTRKYSLFKIILGMLLLPITLAFLFAVAKSNDALQTLATEIKSRTRDLFD